MNCGHILQSIEAWRKLSGFAIVPEVALKILRYTKLVSAEYENIEKLRRAIIQEASGAKDGEKVDIHPNSPEYPGCVKRINELMNVESSLSRINLTFDEIVVASAGSSNALSVLDLAVLEPFFLDSEVKLPKPDGDCSE